jgi:uncharacterized protein
MAMMKPWRVVLAFALFALALTTSWAQAVSSGPAATPPRYRVVMQVSNPEPRAWNQALNNGLALTRNAGKDNVEIHIVANGMGIAMLKENSPAGKLVAAALAQGVKVLACGETMKALQLEREDMLPNIGYVPGGLIEILDRQNEGWRYIKAD